MGALKRGVNPLSHDLGLHICGGRGKHSLRTPVELEELAGRLNLDGTELIRASKLSAKVDNTCLQDGFGLYLHSFILTSSGEWAVVQQGMKPDDKLARRYHWHSPRVRSFVEDPQAGISGVNQGIITNLSDHRAGRSRQSIAEFVREDPDRQLREIRHLVMDRAHDVKPRHVDEKRLGAVLRAAHEAQHARFEDTLLLPGLGPRTLQSLALVGEVIYGAPHRFEDPARFAFAHGGKDGSPFPVPLNVYDEGLDFLREALDRTKVGYSEKRRSLQTLSRFVEAIEQRQGTGADVEAVKRWEKRNAPRYGGRTVFDRPGSRRPRTKPREGDQLSLFGQATV
jgi:hypothetical protein